MWERFPFLGVKLGDSPHPLALRPPRRALVFPLLLLSARLLGAATAPVIDSLTVTPSSVPPGGTVTIAVAAHDPDCTTGTCTTGCGLYVNASLTA